MVNLESVPGKTIHITCHIYIYIYMYMYMYVYMCKYIYIYLNTPLIQVPWMLPKSSGILETSEHSSNSINGTGRLL